MPSFAEMCPANDKGWQFLIIFMVGSNVIRRIFISQSNRGNWAPIEGKSKDDKLFLSVYRRFLGSKNLSIRMMAAKHAWRLLFRPSNSADGYCAQDASYQCKVSELLLSSFKELLSCKVRVAFFLSFFFVIFMLECFGWTYKKPV